MARSSRKSFFAMEGSVFISFCLAELLSEFVSHLVRALEKNKISVVLNYEVKEQLALKKIEESRIALVILTMEYTESTVYLKELTKIKDCVEKGKLVAIPIFYQLDPSPVRDVRKQFGDAFRDLVKSDETKKKELEALTWIFRIPRVTVLKDSPQLHKIIETMKAIDEGLRKITSEESQNTYVDLSYGQILSESADLRYGFPSHFVKALENYIYRNQPGIIIGCLLLLLFVLLQLAYMTISLIYQGGAMYGIVESVQRVQEYIPTEITNNPIHKYTEFPIGEVGAKPGSSTSDAKTNDDFLDRTYTNCPMDSQLKPPQIQVFINFRGDQLRNNFVGYLVDALRRSKINVFIDNQALRGEDLNTLFKRIEDSGIAIVVFSSRYTESKWCLEELVKIKERVQQGLLKVLPIFYNVTPTNVKRLKGEFGDHFRDKEYKYESDEPMIKRWKEAIAFVSHKFALTLDEKSSVLEIDFVETIVKEVLKMLQAISTDESGQSSR